MKSPALLALLSLLFAAPAIRGAEAKSADFKPEDLPGKALVLFSTSADRTSMSGVTILTLMRVPEKTGEPKSWDYAAFYVDNRFVKSHVRGSHMNVHWRALEPGEYYLKRTLANALACFETSITFHFTLTAGTQVYLGDFSLKAGELEVHDSYQRDYDYFASHTGGERPAAFTPALATKRTEKDPDCRP